MNLLKTLFFLPLLVNTSFANSVTSIGYRAFVGNQLKEVITLDSVTRIEDHVFAWNKLAEVTIPNRETSMWSFSLDSDVEIIRE